MKTCSKCGAEKSKDQFGLRNKGKYLKSWCKRCEANAAALRPVNKAKKAEWDRKYRETHKEEKRARDRAYNKKRGYQYRPPTEGHRQACKKWRKANKPHLAAKEARRRVRLRGGQFEPYIRKEVYDRDKGICHLCEGWIDWALSGWDPYGFTVDHVVPVSKGGADNISNVRSAHRICNMKRGVKDVA